MSTKKGLSFINPVWWVNTGYPLQIILYCKITNIKTPFVIRDNIQMKAINIFARNKRKSHWHANGMGDVYFLSARRRYSSLRDGFIISFHFILFIILSAPEGITERSGIITHLYKSNNKNKTQKNKVRNGYETLFRTSLMAFFKNHLLFLNG